MTWVFKRTTTETFEVNTEMLGKVWDVANPDAISLDEALALGGGPMAREAERWLTNMFDLHDGSIHGDKLFSSRADQDSGLVLTYEED